MGRKKIKNRATFAVFNLPSGGTGTADRVPTSGHLKSRAGACLLFPRPAPPEAPFYAGATARTFIRPPLLSG